LAREYVERHYLSAAVGFRERAAGRYVYSAQVPATLRLTTIPRG
jgi:hypothetical protein